MMWRKEPALKANSIRPGDNRLHPEYGRVLAFGTFFIELSKFVEIYRKLSKRSLSYLLLAVKFTITPLN